MPSHKSFHNDTDMNIFNETRTIAPSGLLWSNINLANKTEVDENKAFTKFLSFFFKINLNTSI